MSKEIISLPSGGAIPGFSGGDVGAGTYEIDWDTRAIRRVVDGVAVDEDAQPSEAIPAPAPDPTPEPAVPEAPPEVPAEPAPSVEA